MALAARDLRAMVANGRERGLRVMLTDVLPWNNGDRRAAREIRRLNAMIEDIARDEHVPLLRFNAELADRDHPDRMERRPDGGWRSPERGGLPPARLARAPALSGAATRRRRPCARARSRWT